MTLQRMANAVVYASAPLLACLSVVATGVWLARHGQSGARKRLAIALSSLAAAPSVLMTCQYGWLMSRRLLTGKSFDPYVQSSLLVTLLWILGGLSFLLGSAALLAAGKSDRSTLVVAVIHAISWLVTSYCALQIVVSI